MTDETSKIYLMTKEQAFVELTSGRYEKEEEFETLLADHPSLMDGEQIDPENPRRWLLVGRQVGISDGDVDVARWDLDLLFVDQDAIPTLVEVKRKSDTRLRREVFGQILEYAANAPAFWTADWLKERFAGQHGDPDAELARFLGDERRVDSFWTDMHTNLKRGEMRLVLVADRIPSEVQRIVEFLNESMTLTEVLALELKYYSGSGYSMHVPRVMGRTARMELQRKQASGGASKTSPEMTKFASDYIDMARKQFPDLQVQDSKPRAPGNTWISFFPRSFVERTEVYHQLTSGFAKVIFKGEAENVDQIREKYAAHLEADMAVEVAGKKSVSIAIAVPKLDPIGNPGGAQSDDARKGLVAISRLVALVREVEKIPSQ